ncbi:RagB/SusD family nutrient uptake outer membrane protein [Flagellimonas flava]|uniref:RagB/SusD family nutrient uptake outer membrane protein n=1 Tax=Flagellimonas flava TaxID=570519 RepID=UPI003D65D50F
MKNIKAILLIIASCLFSCDDYLEEELTGGITADGIYSTPEGIHFGLNATYAAFTSLMGNDNGGDSRENGWTLLTLGTDTYTNGSDGGNKSFNRYDTDLNASAGILQAAWEELYVGINTANTVINRAPEIIEDAGELNQILAEARFLRGYYYFWLVRHWGAVHYSADETTGVESEANRTPVPEMYSRILEDMEFAEQTLPAVQNDQGRPTSWAAKMALAEIHLTQGNYDQAAQLSEEVINSGAFSLVRPVEDLWNLDTNENNSELIFSFQYADDPNFDGSGNPAHLFFLMEYDKLDGMKRDIANGRPWKRFKPTDYLLNLYDMEDERYDASFTSVYFSNNPDTAPPGVMEGDTVVWLPRTPLSQAEKDTRPFSSQIYNQDELTERIFPTSRKWEQPNRASVNQPEGSRDFIVYRLAEAYLIASEANALKSAPDQTKALQYLNEVRMRAYNVDNVAALPPIAAVDLDVILEERAKEFAAEGKRWFDLVRTGKLVERVQMHNAGGAPNIQDYHALRPIPLTQIDRSSNDYPQNPGY